MVDLSCTAALACMRACNEEHHTAGNVQWRKRQRSKLTFIWD